ncbi:hypothetical protein [Thalassotalea fusca]
MNIDSCYGNLWLDHIKGKRININDCKLCSSKFSISYNCIHFKTNELWYEKKYLSASRVLEAFLNGKYLGSEELGFVRVPLEEKSQLLNYLSKHRFSDTNLSKEKKLFFDDFETTIRVDGVDINFRIDTAARYSTITNISANSFTTGIATYSGRDVSAEIAILQTEYGYPIVSFVGLGDNLLGIDYLLNFALLEFANGLETDHNYEKELFIDDANMFFDGEITIKGEVFKSRNFCIDTGATQSILMPKFYKKVRKLIEKKPIKKLSANEIDGEMNQLGKIVDLITLAVDGNEIGQPRDIPILFRSGTSSICDIILGKDILVNRISYIDFENRKLSLEIQE